MTWTEMESKVQDQVLPGSYSLVVSWLVTAQFVCTSLFLRVLSCKIGTHSSQIWWYLSSFHLQYSFQIMHILKRWELRLQHRKAEGQISATPGEDLPLLLRQAFLNTNHQHCLRGEEKCISMPLAFFVTLGLKWCWVLKRTFQKQMHFAGFSKVSNGWACLHKILPYNEKQENSKEIWH